MEKNISKEQLIQGPPSNLGRDRSIAEGLAEKVFNLRNTVPPSKGQNTDPASPAEIPVA